MNTFISDIIPRIQKYSQKLDNLILLTEHHWVSLDNLKENKIVYIFRSNNELLIVTNGKVEKAKWEYLGSKSLLIDKSDGSYLLKHGFFDENIMALKMDASEEYAVFVNESKFDGELDSIKKVNRFLKFTYLENTPIVNIDNYKRINRIPEQRKSSTFDEKANELAISLQKVFAVILIIIILAAFISFFVNKK